MNANTITNAAIVAQMHKRLAAAETTHQIQTQHGSGRWINWGGTIADNKYARHTLALLIATDTRITARLMLVTTMTEEIV